jgi:hypothetical protein
MTTLPPMLINEHARLLEHAEKVLSECETNFAAWVAAGNMEQERSDRELDLLRAIVADWRRIVALRTGKPAEPRQVPDRRHPKRKLLRYLLDRERQQLATDRQLFCDALDPVIVRDIKSGLIDRATIWRNWKARAQGYNHAVIGVLFDRERRFNAAEALAWHADNWPAGMIMAETQAMLMARDQKAQAA